MKHYYYKKQRSPLRTILIVCGICIACLLVLAMLPKPFYKDGFKLLCDVEAYARATNENIKSDTDNTIKPDFSSYYKTLIPTWKSNLKEKINWLLRFVGLGTTPLWSPSFFKTQLESLIIAREVKGHKDTFICKITPTAQSKIIIFGNIQGAFHSLSRCLTKLRELEIIDIHFKVTNPDYFIIFTGDVVSRSPYSMETLSLVMRLLQANNENVVYLRGNHESNNYWQEHTLKTELQIRASHLSPQATPLTDEVNKFFNTLPLAIYIAAGNKEFIRISDAGRAENPLLNETNYSQFLTSKADNKYACTPIKESASGASASIADVKIIFRGEKKRETYQPHQGLRLLPPDMGSTAWTILSCPTTVYQKAIKFVHDAFVIITPAPKLDEWKLTLYNRNVQSNDQFKTTTYNLLSGAEEGKQLPATQSAQPPQPIPTQQPITPPQPVQPQLAPTVPPQSPVTPPPAQAPQPTTAPQLTPVQQPATPSAFVAVTPQPTTPVQPPLPPQPSTPPQAQPMQPPAPLDKTLTSTMETISRTTQELAKQVQELAAKISTQQPPAPPSTPQPSTPPSPQPQTQATSIAQPPQQATQPPIQTTQPVQYSAFEPMPVQQPKAQP